MSTRAVRLPLADVECVHLAGLVEEFMSMLTAADDEVDPGIERLAPAVYPEDAEASAEFASATRDDLLDRRAADAAVVRRGLSPFVDAAAESLPEEPVLEPRNIVIHSEDIDAWLRTLTALRLVIATRLDIGADDDQHDPEDPRFGVYDWLAYRLDGLIELADELDEPSA